MFGTRENSSEDKPINSDHQVYFTSFWNKEDGEFLSQCLRQVKAACTKTKSNRLSVLYLDVFPKKYSVLPRCCQKVFCSQMCSFQKNIFLAAVVFEAFIYSQALSF